MPPLTKTEDDLKTIHTQKVNNLCVIVISVFYVPDYLSLTVVFASAR